MKPNRKEYEKSIIFTGERPSSVARKERSDWSALILIKSSFTAYRKVYCYKIQKEGGDLYIL